MSRRVTAAAVLLLGLPLVLSAPSQAVDSEVGHLILKQECSQCHAIDMTGTSQFCPRLRHSAILQSATRQQTSPRRWQKAL